MARGQNCCPPQYTPWSSAEDATVRRLYAQTPRRRLRVTLTAALPGRTWPAIVARAATLDVPREGCAWTPIEDEVLRTLWGEATPGKILRRLPRRTWRSILRRVEGLGIGRIPTGYVPLAVAARQLGYARRTLLRICREAEVPTMRWWGQRATGRPRRGDGCRQDGQVCRWQLVDLTLATIAVEALLARDGESVHGGALRRGVDPMRLRRVLLRQGAYTVGPARSRTPVCLPAAVLDRAAATIRARQEGA